MAEAPSSQAASAPEAAAPGWRDGLLVAVVLVGVMARFLFLGEGELWADEGYTAMLTAGPLEALLRGAAGDVHPPLYFLLVKLSRLVTVSSAEWALRLPSAVLGSLAVALAAGFFRRRLEAGTAVLATALVAFNPLHLFASQEARPYAATAFAAFLLAHALARWQAAEPGSAAGRWWGRALVASELLLVHLHYMAWLLVAALGLEGALRPDRRRWLALQAAVVVGSLPWFVYALPHKLSSGYVGHEWRLPVDALGALRISAGVAASWLDGVYQYSGEQPRWWLPWVLLAAGALAARGRPARAGRRSAWFALLLPLAIVALLQPLTGTLHWLARYLLVLVPWYLLLVGDALEALLARAPRLAASMLPLGLVAVLTAGVAGYVTGPRAHFLREVAGRLPRGPSEHLLVSFDDGFVLAHYLALRGGEELRWVRVAPRAEAPGAGRWSPAAATAREGLGVPGFAPLEELSRWVRAPEGPPVVWVVLTRYARLHAPRTDGFLRSLAEGRDVRKVGVPGGTGGELELLVMTRPGAQPR